MKRGTRISYRYAAGTVVPGKILGPYHKDMPEWFRVELTDAGGAYRCGVHISQITVTDNRA